MRTMVGDIRAELRGVDIVFVIDTTGSMGPAIRNVCSRLQELSEDLSKTPLGPRLAFGIVAYRDHRSNKGLLSYWFSETETPSSYVTRVYPLRDDVASLVKDLKTMKTGGGGGDGAEAVVDGLSAAVHKIAWRQYSQKVMILVGDQPPHGMGAPSDRWPKGCPCGQKVEDIVAVATSKGIIIYAVVVGARSQARKSFESIASLGNGVAITLLDVKSLMSKIQSLLDLELKKTSVDIRVFDAWEKGVPLYRIADSIGASSSEVQESMERLRLKGVSQMDAKEDEEFEKFLKRYQQ